MDGHQQKSAASLEKTKEIIHNALALPKRPLHQVEEEMPRSIRPTIVLDLDDTLITILQQQHPPHAENIPLGLGTWIVKRPYLRRALASLSRYYDLIILSAASQQWVNTAITGFNLQGLFLAALSVDSVDQLHLTGPWILVDDLPFNHPNTQRKLRILGDISPMRVLKAPAFQGDPNDSFLRRLELSHLPQGVL